MAIFGAMNEKSTSEKSAPKLTVQALGEDAGLFYVRLLKDGKPFSDRIGAATEAEATAKADALLKGANPELPWLK